MRDGDTGMYDATPTGAAHTEDEVDVLEVGGMEGGIEATQRPERRGARDPARRLRVIDVEWLVVAGWPQLWSRRAVGVQHLALLLHRTVVVQQHRRDDRHRVVL